jgi:hypothetical protein
MPMRRLLPFLLLPFLGLPAAADPRADALARPALPVGVALPIVLAEGQVLLFRLPDAAEPLVVETRGLAAGTDPLIELQDARGRTLASDDDSGAEPLAARLVVLPRPGTPRLVMVRTLDGAPGAFDLLLSPRPEAPPGTHWTLSEAAQAAPAALPLRLTLETGARVVLRLPDARPDALVVARSLDGRADPALTLLDPDGVPLAQDDDGQGGLDAGIEIPGALAGPHYLRLTMLHGGTVSLSAEDPRPEAPVATAPSSPDAAQAAPPLASREPVRLRLGRNMSAFFRIPAGAWTVRTLNLGRATDTVLRLVAPDGRPLAEDDDGGGGLASRLAIPAERPADALLEATTYDGAGGTFDLLLEPALQEP